MSDETPNDGIGGGSDAENTTPPPPPGGAVPPPPPGGAVPPPPPAGSAYAPPVSVTKQPDASLPNYGFDIMEALKFAWAKFSKSPGQILVPMIIFFAIVFGVGIVLNLPGQMLIAAGQPSTSYDSFNGYQDHQGNGVLVAVGTVFMFAYYVVLFLVSTLLQMGLSRIALAAVKGEPTSVGMLFQFKNYGNGLLAMFLVGLATLVGFCALFVGSIVVAFLMSFTVWFIVGAQSGAIDAIKASFRLTTKNFVPVLLLYVATFVGMLAAVITCGLGVLVVGPVLLLMQAYTFRFLQGETVVA